MLLPSRSWTFCSLARSPSNIIRLPAFHLSGLCRHLCLLVPDLYPACDLIHLRSYSVNRLCHLLRRCFHLGDPVLEKFNRIGIGAFECNIRTNIEQDRLGLDYPGADTRSASKREEDCILRSCKEFLEGIYCSEGLHSPFLERLELLHKDISLLPVLLQIMLQCLHLAGVDLIHITHRQ